MKNIISQIMNILFPPKAKPPIIAQPNSKIINSGRERIEDKIFNEEITNNNYHNKLFVRIGAKKKKFNNVDFSHTYFEHCYFKNCAFNSCNFNGCKFINCNFSGSSFPGSIFDYAIFEKTFIDDDILDNNCPSHDNVTKKFARSLRINFQSLGDSESVNKAIEVELRATKNHLFDSWNSNKRYYREKYGGLLRIKMFFHWLYFKTQEFIWGNGESLYKLIRTGILFLLLMTFIDVYSFHNWECFPDYYNSLINMPSLMFGVKNDSSYSELYLSLITLCRLIGFGLFMSILIKKFNRR